VGKLCLVAMSAGLALVGCQNHSEEQTGPSSGPPGVPTAINPIPVAPAPTPRATATPPPASDPQPAPTPPPGTGGDIPNNTNPVARADAKVTGVYCNGQAMPATTRAPVGCVIRLDVTPKDGHGQATRAKSDPVWTWSDTSFWVGHGGSAYNPTMFGLAPGTTGVYCTVDGILSNAFEVTFY
jgi:hypothetical protein